MQKLKLSSLVLSLWVGTALAQSSIIDTVKKNNAITLGHGEMTIPFTYKLPDEAIPRGFSHDIELIVVEYLKEKLNLPDLKVNYQVVLFNDVFEKVSSGKVNLHCGTTVNSLERQKDFDFSNGFFVATSRLMVRKDSGVNHLKDLKGKKIVTLSNTWSLSFIKSRQAQLGISEVKVFDRLEEAVHALDSGEYVGFFMSDGILAGAKVQLQDPEAWHLVGKSAGEQRYGCIMAKGDKAFKALVDEALVSFYASGEIEKLYDKWFEQPIEPIKKPLNIEMTAATKGLYTMPTDKAIGQN